MSSPPDPAILHVDLDAFYASVEQLADPSLRGRPVVVGGLGPRGVVAASSYEAREFGVFSAMPMARARRACPHAVFLAPRFDAYQEASAQVMAVLRSYTPLVEPIALDEAFLDVVADRRRSGSGPEIAARIRAEVRDSTGLTASVGVATTKLLAKLASDVCKPDGLLVVVPGGELAFLHPLPVERLWGVGPKTRRRLDRFGVRTIGDLAAVPEASLVATLGSAVGQQLHRLAWNRDDRAVEPNRELKSIGHEETFPVDVADPAVLHTEAVRMADRVAGRLRDAGRVARTVQLKVRFGDFRTITRSRTLPEPTDLAAEIAATAGELLGRVDVSEGIRLLGVSVQQLEPADAVQTRLALDNEAPTSSRDRRRAAERSMDAVRARYGNDAVVSGPPRPSASRPDRGVAPEGRTDRGA